jgi:hypothetical protein
MKIKNILLDWHQFNSLEDMRERAIEMADPDFPMDEEFSNELEGILSQVEREFGREELDRLVRDMEVAGER